MGLFGNKEKKIVLAGGVFDIIHPGHIHTLNAAKALGGILVVAIATDKTAQKMKKRPPLHNQELRRELVSYLSMVDKAVIGHEDDIFETVKEIKPDIIVLGYDQIHQEKFIDDAENFLKQGKDENAVLSIGYADGLVDALRMAKGIDPKM